MDNKKVSARKARKKEARQRVYDKLVVALAEFKKGSKDKKFERNLRKTSKLFAVDLLKSSKKERQAKAKIVKKQTENNPSASVHKTA
jgi:hypothetical protein